MPKIVVLVLGYKIFHHNSTVFSFYCSMVFSIRMVCLLGGYTSTLALVPFKNRNVSIQSQVNRRSRRLTPFTTRIIISSHREYQVSTEGKSSPDGNYNQPTDHSSPPPFLSPPLKKLLALLRLTGMHTYNLYQPAYYSLRFPFKYLSSDHESSFLHHRCMFTRPLAFIALHLHHGLRLALFVLDWNPIFA